MKLSPSQLRHLGTYYVFANTPAYLYRQLRNDESVRHLARSVSPVQLFEEFEQTYAAHKKDGGLEEMTYLYALLAAMTLLEPGQASELLDRIGNTSLAWKDEFEEILSVARTPETRSSLGNVTLAVGSASVGTPLSSTSTTQSHRFSLDQT